MSGVFSIASHCVLQYFSGVTLQEQIGWAHFVPSLAAICVYLHWIWIRIPILGRPQQIALFSDRIVAPLTVGLLFDTSRSERNLLSNEQDMASRFIHEVLDARDMAAIIGFDSEVTLLADLTENTAILDHAIHKTGIQPPQKDASTTFYDAIYLACDELRDQAGRKILLIVSDAEDSGSHVTMRDAIEAVQRANSVIYVLRIADPQFSSGYGFGSRGDVVAQIIARETGGRMSDI